MRFTSCGQWHLIGTMRQHRMQPSTLAVARAVGWVTFLEIIRDKILYNIILCAGLLLSVGFLASRLTFIRPERIILDFGLTGVTISCAMIAIFTGAGLLNKEFERRTIYVALCHPISRAQFLFGKFVGLGLVIFLNWVLLSGAYLGILFFASPDGSDLTRTLLSALSLVLIQTLMVASITLFFSSFTTTSLSAIMTIGLYLIGNNTSQIRLIASKSQNEIAKYFLNGISYVVPNLEHFNFGLKTTYGLPIEVGALALASLYGLIVTATLLILSGLILGLKEV